MARPDNAVPIGFTDQSGNDIARVAGLVWLGDQLTGSTASDQDISDALVAAGLPDSFANMTKVRDILAAK
jgi:hypothetical protein